MDDMTLLTVAYSIQADRLAQAEAHRQWMEAQAYTAARMPQAHMGVRLRLAHLLIALANHLEPPAAEPRLTT